MKRIIFIVLLVVGFCFYFVTDRNEIANDYYDVINKEFFSHDYLNDDDYIYNTFVLAQDESNVVRDEIVSDVVSNKIDMDYSSDIKILYDNILDSDERNEVGLGTLRIYIDSIMNSNNIDNFISNCMVLERELGIDIFTRMAVDKDFLDNSRNIIYLYPVTFAFGSTGDYFVDENYMTYKAYIKRAIINLLEKYGYSKGEARMVSSEIITFYEEISEDSKLSSSYDDVTSYYNIVDREYLSDIYSNLDINKYLSDIDQVEYSLVDEAQYKKINEYLDDKYLLLWKKCVLVKILSSYASYLDMDYRKIVIDLNNSLTGAKEDVLLDEDAVEMVSSVFANEIDKEYDSRVITDNDKTYLNDMFIDIKMYFREMLKNNEWLSEDTIDQALLKIDAMDVYIGMYDNMKSNIEVNGDNLIDNVISINKSNYRNELSRLSDNSDIKAMSEVLVNAYYNPMTNAVYIPSSVMFLLDNNADYYERLGTIGMIIAHEITHGFDYNGSLFDSNGNLNNWWNDTDRDNYTKLRDEVVKYYNKIEVIDGKCIDGEATVNENIADMGALKIITGVALDNGGGDKELRRMYSSFAEFWRSQVTDEYAKLLLLNDSHSPNKYRVNAVLSLIDGFYKVYNVYPWNDMYVESSKRISVW